MNLKPLLSGIIIAGSLFVLSACTDAYEERGLCSYLGTCEISYCEEMGSCPINYCKELGSCDDGIDHTAYSTSGKPVKSQGSPGSDTPMDDEAQ